MSREQQHHLFDGLILAINLGKLPVGANPLIVRDIKSKMEFGKQKYITDEVAQHVVFKIPYEDPDTTLLPSYASMPSADAQLIALYFNGFHSDGLTERSQLNLYCYGYTEDNDDEFAYFGFYSTDPQKITLAASDVLAYLQAHKVAFTRWRDKHYPLQDSAAAAPKLATAESQTAKITMPGHPFKVIIEALELPGFTAKNNSLLALELDLEKVISALRGAAKSYEKLKTANPKALERFSADVIDQLEQDNFSNINQNDGNELLAILFADYKTMTLTMPDSIDRNVANLFKTVINFKGTNLEEENGVGWHVDERQEKITLLFYSIKLSQPTLEVNDVIDFLIKFQHFFIHKIEEASGGKKLVNGCLEAKVDKQAQLPERSAAALPAGLGGLFSSALQVANKVFTAVRDPLGGDDMSDDESNDFEQTGPK